MSTQRKLIRKKVAELLAGATNAGASVFASRARAVFANELPAILVYSREETVTIYNASPRELQHVLTLVIEIAATADEELDDLLDDIAQQVIDRLNEYQTLDGTASDRVLTGSQLQIVGEGENQHGACALTYEVTYYTFDVATGLVEPNLITPFETATVTHRPNGADENSPPVSDTISLPQ